MAPGRKTLRRIQMGLETTNGTAVSATTYWRGAGNMLDDQRVIEEIEEQVGIMDGTDRTALVKLFAGIEYADTPLSFEQFQIPILSGLGGTTSGSADGSGSGKIYTTVLPTTATVTPKAYTIEGGDDFEAERMEYSVPTKMKISGKAGESSKVSITWLGRQVSTNAFTSSLSLPTVETVVTSKGKVYLDAVAGTYGGTQVSNQILAYELNYDFMWIPKFTMDGNLYFTFVTLAGVGIAGKLTFEHDTAVSGTGGAKAHFRGETPRLLRIALDGSALTTNGTTYSTKKLIVDHPIKYTKAGVIGDESGNDIVDMEFKSRYNTTVGNRGKFIAVHEVSPIP